MFLGKKEERKSLKESGKKNLDIVREGGQVEGAKIRKVIKLFKIGA